MEVHPKAWMGKCGFFQVMFVGMTEIDCPRMEVHQRQKAWIFLLIQRLIFANVRQIPWMMESASPWHGYHIHSMNCDTVVLNIFLIKSFLNYSISIFYS